MSDEKIGPLAKDTVIVLTIASVAGGLIVALTGLFFLANLWNHQSEPDMEEVHYDFGGHGGHGDEHGDDHGDEHGDEESHDEGESH